MLFRYFKRFLKYPKTRLKMPGQFLPKGARVLFNKPAVGWFFWFLVWLSAVLLLILANGSQDVSLSPGQLSPVTVITSVEFGFPSTVPAQITTEKQRVNGSTPGDRRFVIMQIPVGTKLVERGQKVTAEMAEKNRAYQTRVNELTPPFQRVLKFIGAGIILLMGVIVSAAGLRLIKPDSLHRNSMILLFFLISLLGLLPCRWCLMLNQYYFPLPQSVINYLLPVVLAPLLAVILMGALPALVMGFWVSLAASVFADYSFTIFTTGLVATVVIARLTRFVRTRATVFRMGFWAGLAGAACALGFSAVTCRMWDAVIARCLFCVISGILSALVVLLILPLMETLFGISTDISLLELSDMEHPLLKRLAIEAPGTYHHSLMVANLAQAAVTAIGGNALRTTICSYFHDIGKLVKPAFFSENIQFSDNPHDDLSPSMSTLVVISHVKEGVDLALRYKLPQSVVDAIQQHHGTGLVYYFFHKASSQQELDSQDKTKTGTKSSVSEESFRYPGPKPKSREIAIISLADSIEAASRTLEKISPSNIEHLVHNVVDVKLHDGQLDLCDLTLAEINKVKKVFVFTLTNMSHGRISYPVDENRGKQQTGNGPSKRGQDNEAHPVSNGKGPSS